MEPTLDHESIDLEGNLEQAIDLIKSLANDRRLLIMCHLIEGRKTVGELERLVGLSQSAVSQHLSILRLRRLVSTERIGMHIYYEIDSPEAKELLATLHRIYCA